MKHPEIRSTIRDDINNNTFIVMAHRRLTREELMAMVREFYALPKIRRRERPLRNASVRLPTPPGLSRERLAACVTS